MYSHSTNKFFIRNNLSPNPFYNRLNKYEKLNYFELHYISMAGRDDAIGIGLGLLLGAAGIIALTKLLQPKCPNCGKGVSKRNQVCPHCGVILYWD